MTDPIERLRASKAQYYTGLKESAGDAGYTWAEDSASYEELTLLSNVDFDDAPHNPSGARGALAEWVAGQIELHVADIFPDAYEMGRLPTDDYADTFFKHALAYFSKVKHQL